MLSGYYVIHKIVFLFSKSPSCENRVFLFLCFSIFIVLTDINSQSDLSPKNRKIKQELLVFPNPLNQAIIYFESEETGIKK